jgi:hypothetical protein
LADIATIRVPVPSANQITNRLYNIVQSIINNNSLFLSDLCTFLEKKPEIKREITLVTKKGEDDPLAPIVNFMVGFGSSYRTLMDKYKEYFGKMEEYENFLINKEMNVKNDDKNKEEDFLKAIAEAKKNYSAQLTDTTKSAKDMFECSFQFEDKLLGKYVEFVNNLFEFSDEKLKLLLREYQDMRESFKILKENVNFERQKNINYLNNIYRKYPLLSLHEYVSNRNGSTQNKPEAYKKISLINIENIKKEMESKGLEIDYEQLKDEKMNIYFEDKFKLFYGEEAIKDEIKNEIINYLRTDEDNFKNFFTVINKNRNTNNGKFVNEDNIIFLTDILDMMLDFALRKGDIEKCDGLLMVFTNYYIMKEGKKIHVDEYFKKNHLEKHKRLFNNPYFWENYLYRQIQNKVLDKTNNKRVREDKNRFIQDLTYSGAISILGQIKIYDLGNNLEVRFLNLLVQHGKLTREKSSEIKALLGIKENN